MENTDLPPGWSYVHPDVWEFNESVLGWCCPTVVLDDGGYNAWRDFDFDDTRSGPYTTLEQAMLAALGYSYVARNYGEGTLPRALDRISRRTLAGQPYESDDETTGAHGAPTVSSAAQGDTPTVAPPESPNAALGDCTARCDGGGCSGMVPPAAVAIAIDRDALRRLYFKRLNRERLLDHITRPHDACEPSDADLQRVVDELAWDGSEFGA